jgi:hypothetical protein
MDMIEAIDEMIAELKGEGPPRCKYFRSKRTDKNYMARVGVDGLVELTYILPLEWEEDEHR